MKIAFTKEDDLDDIQKKQIQELSKECFGDIGFDEVEDDFIAESFGRIFAYDNATIIGMMGLYKRLTEYEGENIILGGMGGICVTSNMRGRGVATQMLQKGLEILKDENCDVACLNVDRSKGAFKLYQNLGFKFLDRDISFEDAKGNIKKDGDSMFVPLNSNEKYNKIMNGKSTYHQGKGYW